MRRRTKILLGFFLAASLAGVIAIAATREPGIGAPAPDFSSKPWINSPPLTMTELRGKVVLVEFWTYG